MNPFYDEVRRLSDCQKIIQEKIRHLAAEKGLTNKQCGPIPDGVEDIEGYLSSSPKVMWVLKEAWGEVSEDGSVNGGGHCIYDSWDTTAFGILTWDVMMYVMYGIRQGNKRVEYRDMPKADDSMLTLLKQCAYTNVNKMPGYSRSGNLREEYAVWKHIIDEQIEIYNPEIIIFGGTFDMIRKMGNQMLKDAQFIEKTPSDVAHLYRDTSGRLLLNAMHPAQTTLGREWYIDEIVDAIRKNL